MNQYLANAADFSVADPDEDQPPIPMVTRPRFQPPPQMLSPVPYAPQALDPRAAQYLEAPDDDTDVIGTNLDAPDVMDQQMPGFMGVTPGVLQDAAMTAAPYQDPESSGPSGYVTNPTPAPASSPYPPRSTPHLDALERLEGQRPVASKPKWYQNLAAGALGGAVGWTNAAGRIPHPIDPSEAIENIKHPGYQTKLQDWRDRVAQTGKLAEIEAKRNVIDRQDRVDANATILHNAQTNLANEHAAYWKHRAQEEPNRYHENAKGEIIDLKTGKIMNKPPTMQERYEEYKHLGLSDEDARYATVNGKLQDKTDKNKTVWESYLDWAKNDPDKAIKRYQADQLANSKARRSLTAGPTSLDADIKRLRKEALERDVLDKVDQKKNQTVNTVMQQRDQARRNIAGSSGMNATDKQRQTEEADNKAASALQDAQNLYERELRERGQSPGHIKISVGPGGHIMWTTEDPMDPAGLETQHPPDVGGIRNIKPPAPTQARPMDNR